MKMSNAVDPYQLLKALGPLLTADGAIKNEAQVPRIAGLMNGARKLVSRCIYVNILRATNNASLLKSFVVGGGWELLNNWLQEAKESNNIAFLTDLLKALRKLPVTIGILKKNNTAKLIKQMSKTESDERLKALAEDVVSEWMKVIKQTHENSDSKPAAASTSSVVVKKKKKKLVRTDASGKGESEGDAGMDGDAHPAPKKLRTDKEPDHERTKKDNPSKAEQEAKSRLSAQGKSPKSEKSASRASSEEEKAVEKAEKLRHRKITRPAHTKFRSTGLEKASTLPPVKIKKKSSEAPPPLNKGGKAAPVKREGPIFGKSLLPPEKKPKVDIPTSSVPSKTSSATSSVTTASTAATASAASNNHSRTKLIPAKHKLVHESSNFMDALNAPAIPIRKVKMKKPQAKPTSPTTNKPVRQLDTPKDSRSKEEESVGRVDSPQETKPDPPKFCFYSSGQNDEENADKTSEGKDEGAGNADKKNAGGGGGGTGNLKLIPTKSKKCVKWREEDKLVDIHYFEMDDTERVNVNRPKDFRNAAHLEMVMEREAMKNAKLQGEGASPNLGGNDLLPWRAPVRLQVLDVPPVDYGVNSLEKGVQKQREMVVLQEIYFDKNMIPETPKEPDPEPFEPKEPTRIPLEDETKRKPEDEEAADSSQGSTPLYSEPVLPGGNHPAHAPPRPPAITLPPGLQLDNLPPAIASLVQQIPANLPGVHPPAVPTGNHGQPPPGPGRPSEPPSASATITNVQNLLNSIMGNQGDAQPTQEELTNKLRDMLEPFKNQLPGSLGPPQPNHPGGPNFNPEGWGPRGPPGPPGPPGHPGPPGPPGPGPIRGRGGMGPRFGGPGRGGFNPRYNGPPFHNGPSRFPGPGGPPDMPPRGPPRPLMGPGGGPWPPRGGGGGGGRGRGAINFAARPVCRHFMTPRGCERAQSCQFYHPGVNGPPLTQ